MTAPLQRVGIELEGWRPTKQERENLQRELDTRDGIFKLEINRCWYPTEKCWRTRLDAIEIEETVHPA